MSLTSRAKVLQTLGLTDDAAAAPALAVAFDPSALTSVVVTTNSTATTLTVTPTPGSATVLDLTAAAYDTLSEVAAAVEALASIECAAVPPNASAIPSVLLDASQTVTLNSSNVLGSVTYSNTASGLVSALIDQMILDVDAAVDRYTGRNFSTSGSRTEKYDGDGTPFLQLRSFPVTSVSSVSLVDDSGSTTALAATDWRVDLTTGRLVLNRPVQTFGGSDPRDGWSDASPQTSPIYSRGWASAFPVGFQNVAVTYTALSTVPADLERVATEMVVELYLNRRTNPRVGSESVSPMSRNYLSPSDVARRFSDRLAPFVRPVC